MYSQIVNPETGRRVNVSGKIGQKVIRNYLNQYQSGGGLFGFKSKREKQREKELELLVRMEKDALRQRRKKEAEQRRIKKEEEEKRKAEEEREVMRLKAIRENSIRAGLSEDEIQTQDFISKTFGSKNSFVFEFSMRKNRKFYRYESEKPLWFKKRVHEKDEPKRLQVRDEVEYYDTKYDRNEYCQGFITKVNDDNTYDLDHYDSFGDENTATKVNPKSIKDYDKLNKSYPVKPVQISNPMPALLNNNESFFWKDENNLEPYIPPLFKFFDVKIQGGLYANTQEEEEEAERLCESLDNTAGMDSYKIVKAIDENAYKLPNLSARIKAFKFIVDTVVSYEVTDPHNKNNIYTGIGALDYVFNKLKFTESGDGRNNTILEYLVYDGAKALTGDNKFLDMCEEDFERILHIYAYSYITHLIYSN